jgi:hypothetical protein
VILGRTGQSFVVGENQTNATAKKVITAQRTSQETTLAHLKNFGRQKPPTIFPKSEKLWF